MTTAGLWTAGVSYEFRLLYSMDFLMENAGDGIMSTVCTICGNSHDTPRQSKNCELRSRKIELENEEVVEFIMKLSLHTKIF